MLLPAPGRCYYFFQQFQQCYLSVDNPQACRPQVEDYNECLFHKKAIAREQQLLAQTQVYQAKHMADTREEKNKKHYADLEFMRGFQHRTPMA